jgi:hypothetical protein
VFLAASKGGRENKTTKVTHICRSPKTKVVDYFILFNKKTIFKTISLMICFYRVFGCFVTRGVQKHEEKGE